MSGTNSEAWGELYDGENRYDLCGSIFTIGRFASNDFVIAKAHISGTHLRIRASKEGPVAVDCSSNGTYINGTIVGKNKEVILKSGDMIQVSRSKKSAEGNPEFRFEFRNAARCLEVAEAASMETLTTGKRKRSGGTSSDATAKMVANENLLAQNKRLRHRLEQQSKTIEENAARNEELVAAARLSGEKASEEKAVQYSALKVEYDDLRRTLAESQEACKLATQELASAKQVSEENIEASKAHQLARDRKANELDETTAKLATARGEAASATHELAAAREELGELRRSSDETAHQLRAAVTSAEEALEAARTRAASRAAELASITEALGVAKKHAAESDELCEQLRDQLREVRTREASQAHEAQAAAETREKLALERDTAVRCSAEAGERVLEAEARAVAAEALAKKVEERGRRWVQTEEQIKVYAQEMRHENELLRGKPVAPPPVFLDSQCGSAAFAVRAHRSSLAA